MKPDLALLLHEQHPRTRAGKQSRAIVEPDLLLGAELNAEIEHQTARIDRRLGATFRVARRGHGRHCGSKAVLVSDFVVWVRAV